MSVTWTKEQQEVIDLRDCSLLVSAAAGSGKTAVLVERIIKRLTKDEALVDVDELLIVTYTEAAAAEMKERIREAIQAELFKHPQDERLQRQATLINGAKITTIHSFCLSVIREHFHRIDLDPGFRIGEEGELKLLRQDVLENVLEEAYAKGDEDFTEFVNGYASGRDDKQLEELIMQVYDFSRSFPDADGWLASCAEQYIYIEGKECPFLERALLQVKNYLDGMEELLCEAKVYCQEADGPYMYLDMVESDLEQIQEMKCAQNFERMSVKVREMKWKKLAANRDKEVSAETASMVKNLREEAKKIWEDIKEQYFYEEIEELWADMEQAGRMAGVLISLVRQFEAAFAKEKASKNMIDFGDMEHMALKILTVEEEGGRKPSQAALEYQKKFKEVMIDEYQDSNYIQEAILTSVSSVHRGQDNIFMVGDVKQSIYRFRLSRPELFMEKYETYSPKEGRQRRIGLHKNFRSRTEVLDGVNFFFKQIMTKELGHVAYDEDAALYPGASYEPAENMQPEIAIIDMDASEHSECEPKELEGRFIAARIREFMEQMQVLDKKSGEYRKACYKDMVILVRSVKGYAETLAKTLAEEGIPAFTGSKEGYFETQEISLILDYLSVLDNKKQDLPLTAVLTSAIGGFDVEALACIKSEYRELPFYEAVWRYAKEGKDTELKEKLKEFWAQILYFREMLPYMAIHELLWKILDETGYGNYVSAMPDGNRRKANLEMLVEKARVFETTSYKGVFNFVRYIEKLQKYDIDYGEANVEDESADVVRIMSIHKSKGLEFPIVFVAGMNGKFNTQDIRGSVIVHPEFGIGLDAVDVKMRTKIPTILKKVIQREIKLENTGEELRVLYVALTRAKEKLVMVGTMSNLQKKLQNASGILRRKEKKLPFFMLARADSYYGFLFPAMLRAPKIAADLAQKYDVKMPFFISEYEKQPFVLTLAGADEILQASDAADVAALLTKESFQNLDVTAEYDRQMKENLRCQFSYRYPYENEQKRKGKFTVSELKRIQYEDELGEPFYEETSVEEIIPAFIAKEEIPSGAFRGTAYHKIMELLDHSRTYGKEDIEMLLRGYAAEEKMTPEMCECIRKEDILTFLSAKVAGRMKKAAISGALYKEQPFVLGVAASEIYEEAKGQDSLEEDMLLVQGIIDVWFEEEDGIVVLDYKTDKIRRMEELREKYHRQLDYYAKALERLTGKKVKEKIIYSFALGQEMSI